MKKSALRTVQRGLLNLSPYSADLTLSLITLWPETSRLPIDGVGLGFTYTTADSFEGWAIGLSFGQ